MRYLSQYWVDVIISTAVVTINSERISVSYFTPLIHNNINFVDPLLSINIHKLHIS
jgi:hypothetical protein